MAETLPVDPAGAGASSDREARIEQLLLSGLDHYFAGKYEEAINIWTRVAFLERGHGRARAYIERARGAQAERQRQNEELVQRGVSAYQAGDMESARTLLTRAIDEGGPTDLALVFLQRLNRYAVAADHGDVRPTGIATGGPARSELRQDTRWLPTLLVSTAIALAIVLLAFPIASWIAELPIGTPRTEIARPEPLPIVRTSEMLVARARVLHASGKLRDALSLLDRIAVSDPVHADAERVRASVQRDLLAGAGVPLEVETGAAR
jgi:tetratricopeptide (TPR) repeat protein